MLLCGRCSREEQAWPGGVADESQQIISHILIVGVNFFALAIAHIVFRHGCRGVPKLISAAHLRRGISCPVRGYGQRVDVRILMDTM